ncbi:DUF7344 domain-containing protein [Halosimplex sp. J119]
MTDTTSDRPTGFANPEDRSTDDVYLLLRSERRRLVLDVLSNEHAATTLDDLAAEVAARESDFDADDERAMSRLKTALHHNHLPKLAEADALEYDPATHRVDP